MGNESWRCLSFSQQSIDETVLKTTDLLQRKVCIIGGGVTGLGIAGILDLKGISCVIMDKQAQLGGLWANHNATYAGLQIHTPSYYFQYLDDEVYCDLHALLNHRRTVAEQLQYFKTYAQRHRVVFLGNVEVRHHYANQIEVRSKTTRQNSTMHFDWVINCTHTRPNSGNIRVLPNAEVLTERVLSLPKSSRIFVVGAGKSGADAIFYLKRHDFTNIVWVCSRKIGFAPREKFLNRLLYFDSLQKIMLDWFERNTTDKLIEDIISPHDDINCYKFGVVSKEELTILQSVRKVYGCVSSVTSHQTTFSKRFEQHLNLVDNRRFTCEAVISALGADSSAFINEKIAIAKRYHDPELLLDTIDPINRIMYVRNTSAEAATGASLEGLLAAAFIKNEINIKDLSSFKRTKLPMPNLIAGCMLGGIGSDLTDDGLVRESYILNLLGHPQQHQFRLLDHSVKIKLLSL